MSSRFIYRFLDKNGDGSGADNANEDYSGLGLDATEFFFQADDYVALHRMIIHIVDTNGVTAQEYGNLGAALTNGYNVRVLNSDDSEVLDLCDGSLIKTNGDIGRYCYDVDVKQFGSGDEFIQARWTFAKAGAPLELSNGQKLSITLNDDLDGLIEHYFMVQGYRH